MTTPYCTLAQVKAELNANTTTDDATILPLILRVSARIDAMMGGKDFFAPLTASRYYPIEPYRVSSYYNTFKLHDNVLTLDAVSVGSQALTVGSQVNVYPPGDTPYHQLRMIDRGISWYWACSTDDTQPVMVEVTGTFGYRRGYPVDAWIALDALGANITASALTLTVADADGTDEYGITPRFSIGSLILIDSERMTVVAVNTTTNTLTVRRATNGSTAAAHTAGAAVSVYRPEEAIVRATARQTAFMYARRGAFEGAVSNDFGTVTFPQDILSEINGILQDIQYG